MCLIIVCIKVTNSWNHSLRHPGCDRGGGLKTKNFKCRLTDWKPPTRKFWWHQLAYYLWCIRSQTSETVLCSSLAVGGGGWFGQTQLQNRTLSAPLNPLFFSEDFQQGLQAENLFLGVTNPWPLCFGTTEFSDRSLRYEKTGFKIGFSDPNLLRKDTQHYIERQKEVGFRWWSRTCGRRISTFGSGVTDTQKLVFKSDSTNPIRSERKPNTMCLAKTKLPASGHETNPRISSFGSEITDTRQMVSKSDSATPNRLE